MVNSFDSLLSDLLNEDMPVEAFEEQWIDHAHQSEGDQLVWAQVASSNNNNNTANWNVGEVRAFLWDLEGQMVNEGPGQDDWMEGQMVNQGPVIDNGDWMEADHVHQDKDDQMVNDQAHHSQGDWLVQAQVAPSNNNN